MRNSSIDIMKGVGIIAVIIGHCVLPTIIKNFIYSWHMPLFFIISGYFHKSTSIKNTIKKNFYSILVPYLATSLFMVILNFFHDNPYPNIHFHTITAIFVGSGTWGNNISIFETYFVGALWFLLALFWCRFLYSILEINFSNPYIRGGVIILLSTLSNLVSQSIFIPTNLLQGISALLFYYLGHIVNQTNIETNKISWKIMFTTMILLTISIPLGCVLMVANYYPLLPLNFVTAVFVVYNLYHITRRISQNESMFVNVLKFVGKSSILVLCIHIIELDYDPIPDLFLKINISKYITYTITILYRVLVTIIVTYILYQFIIIRRLYQLK